MYQKDVSRSHINVLITYFRHSHPLIKHQMIFFKYHINHMRMLHDYTFLVVLDSCDGKSCCYVITLNFQLCH